MVNLTSVLHAPAGLSTWFGPLPRPCVEGRLGSRALTATTSASLLSEFTPPRSNLGLGPKSFLLEIFYFLSHVP